MVTDSNDCELEVNNLIITEPSVVDIVILDIESVSCSGAQDGSIQIDDGGKLLGEINYRDKNNKQEEFKDWKAL